MWRTVTTPRPGRLASCCGGTRGLVNEVYLRDLPHKIRRGLAGQIERGFHAGGMSYGYQSVPVGMNSHGDAEGFRLEIVPVQAVVVREIFERYSGGESLQRIVADLNERRVPGPGRKRNKPSTWSVSALYGTPKDGSGLLNNQLYIGRYVWNRREWVKDPDNPTRRTPRMRPREEWKTAERPDLRIVTDELWQAVRTRMQSPRHRSGQRGRSPPMRTLFGGLLRCAICGGAMVAVQKHYYGCAAHKDRGPAVCPGTFAPRRETDARLVAELQKEVLAPEAIAKIEDRVRSLLGELHDQARDAATARTARINELTAEIGRLVDAIVQMSLSPALRDRLTAAEQELARLNTASRQSPSTGVDDSSEIRTRINAMAAELQAALASDIPVARDMLSKKLGDIVVEERDDGVYAQIDIGPVLLRAAGANVSKSGCGGRI